MRLLCHKCLTRYQLSDKTPLGHLTTSTCSKCGTQFVFFVIPETVHGASAAGVEQPQDANSQFLFHGAGESLFGIHIVNIFLTLLSLGVYYFWAKIKVRQYFLSQTEFRWGRFAYHGTGKELLIGFLKATLVFGIPYVCLMFVPGLLGAGGVVQAGAFFLAQGLILVFIPSTMVSARRYRFSRMSWLGIRFSLRGRRADFIKLYVGGWLLTLATLGAYYPFFDVKRQAFLVSHSFVGNQPAHFDGHGWDLSPSFVTSCLLTPVTLGLCWFWYLAKRHRYFWNRTSFTTVRFRSTVMGRPFLNLKGENLLLLVMTFGLAWPWVAVRNLRFILTHLSLEGPLDLERIRQEAQTSAATGDVLSDFLDTGTDLG